MGRSHIKKSCCGILFSREHVVEARLIVCVSGCLVYCIKILTNERFMETFENFWWLYNYFEAAF